MMYKDKIVLITGASRGVGFLLTKHFINNGAIVIGISRNSSDFQSPNYNHFSIDIGDPDSISTCFKKQISKQFTKIDIVINNAALMTSQYSMIMPIKNAVDMVSVNLLGVFFISREASKLMRGSEQGRIINIGSMATSLEPIGDSIYAATKSAIITLANIMSKELSSLNVTCNTLAISAFESDMLNSHSSTAKVKIQKIVNNLTIPRMAKGEDIINVIDFFASEKSSYITAQTIYLGGIN